ncbi:MAG: Nif11-like leader peptide family natural product precursor, partial [Syntrophomonadaceae bacterium]
MSIESAKAFVEKIKSDEEFAKKVQGCKDKEERI